MTSSQVPPISRWTTRLLLVAAPLLFVAPILWTGKLPRGADHVFHFQLAHGFVEGLHSGVWYPRWLLGANLGYGSPAPINYPPFGAYLVALPQLLGLSPMTAWVLALALSACGAAWAFYAFAKDLVAPLPAALGAVLYTLAPYHALNLYDRFAFAELNAFIWLPLVFKYQRRLHQRQDLNAWLLFTVSFALLVVTHIVTAYLAVFFVVVYGFVLPSPVKRWRALSLTAAAGLAGCLLAAVYLAPVALEAAAQTHPDYFLKVKWGAFMRNFVFRNETEFGFVRAKIGDAVDNGVAVAGLMMLLSMLAIIRGDRGLTRESWALIALASLAAFMQFPVSVWLWRTVPNLDLVSFPWRFQTFQTLFVALLVAVALPQRGAWIVKGVLVLVATLSIVLAASFVTRSRLLVAEKSLTSPVVVRFVQAEHIPRGVRPWPKFPGKATLPVRGRIDTTGDARAMVQLWQPQHRTLQVDARTPSTVRLHTFNFPGWRATLDGRPVAHRADGPVRVIAVDVPPGHHQVDLTFTDTPARRGGLITSGVTALLLLLSFAAMRWIGWRRT